MNDILKSLTVIDSAGKVICVNYDSHKSTEELMKNALVVPEGEGLIGLLRLLVGQEIKVTATKAYSGKLVGIQDNSVDMGEENVVLTTAQVNTSSQISLLSEAGQIDIIQINQIKGIEILSEAVLADLRYFLELTRLQRKEGLKNVVITLDNKKSHDLSISYLAEMPIWRVSYRFVYEKGNSLLQGWGIVDNPLEEDLEDVQISLVAGQPVSFVYDFYTPPKAYRPLVSEQPRAVQGAVEFESMSEQPPPAPKEDFACADVGGELAETAKTMPGGSAPAVVQPLRRERVVSSTLAQSATIAASARQAGSFFKYDVVSPVSIKRGQSAMLPILQQKINCEKVLLYNYQKNPDNPIISLRFVNKTTLTLERGPLTVFEGGGYAGEAILPFTEEGAEQFIPYATELGIKISQSSYPSSEFKSAYLSGWYLMKIQSEKIHTTYRVENKKNESITVLLEHPKSSGYSLVDTRKPDEETENNYRWKVVVPAGKYVEFAVILEREVSYSEHLQNLTHSLIENYLHAGQLSKELFEKLAFVSDHYQHIKELGEERNALESERKRFLDEQERLRKNIQALSGSMDESIVLRKKYVAQLDSQENRIQQIQHRISEIDALVLQLNKEIANYVNSLVHS